MIIIEIDNRHPSQLCHNVKFNHDNTNFSNAIEFALGLQANEKADVVATAMINTIRDHLTVNPNNYDCIFVHEDTANKMKYWATQEDGIIQGYVLATEYSDNYYYGIFCQSHDDDLLLEFVETMRDYI